MEDGHITLKKYILDGTGIKITQKTDRSRLRRIKE